ncbi:MAG: hypothetical protein U1E73_09035 [Planctomycetota bacterium]
MRATRLSWLAAFTVLAGMARAQDAPAAKKPLRVHVIGASVSGGFRDGPLFGAKEQGDSVTLQQVLKPWADGKARVTTHSPLEMTVFFEDPFAHGENEIQAAKKAKADLVVAIDFPFWFAYGRVGGDAAAARKERLGKGLEMLASLDVPVLLGDLPDMHGAAKRMLADSMIPSVEQLRDLNAQLVEFVQQHPKLHLVELSGIVHTMRDQGVVLPLADGPLPTAKGALQQEDRLHATRLGMAYLGFTIQGALAAACPDDHPLRQQSWSFERFVVAAGAESDLEALKAAAAAPAGAGSGR